MKAKKIKKYYIRGEFYDMVNMPKGFKRIFHKLREKVIVGLIKKYSQASIILDVGCGTGLVTRHIRTGQVVGLDINLWNLKRLREHTQTETVLGDAERLPIRSESVDVIICTEVLEHLLYPKNTLSEIVRVLKPKGRLIGSVPSKSLLWNFRRIRPPICRGSEPFHRNYTINELRTLLQTQGKLKILDIFISKFVLELSLFFVVEK